MARFAQGLAPAQHRARRLRSVAVLNDPKCRSRYAADGRVVTPMDGALRSVADRLLGVACVLLQGQVLFDPDHDRRAAPQPRAVSLESVRDHIVF